MSNEDVAEQCGYEKVKGYVEIASNFDVLVKEKDLELKEYWYNETTEMFFENTTEGLDKLYDLELKDAK